MSETTSTKSCTFFSMWMEPRRMGWVFCCIVILLTIGEVSGSEYPASSSAVVNVTAETDHAHNEDALGSLPNERIEQRIGYYGHIRRTGGAATSSGLQALLDCISNEEQGVRYVCVDALADATGEGLSEVRRALQGILESKVQPEGMKRQVIETLKIIGCTAATLPALAAIIENASAERTTRFHAARLYVETSGQVEGLEYLTSVPADTIYISTWAGGRSLMDWLVSEKISPETWGGIRKETRDLVVRALREGDKETRLLVYEGFPMLVIPLFQLNESAGVSLDQEIGALIQELSREKSDVEMAEASRKALDYVSSVLMDSAKRRRIVELYDRLSI